MFFPFWHAFTLFFVVRSLSKMFKIRVCGCGPIKIISPDGKALEYAKKLVMIGKNIIAEMAESGIK